MVRPRELGPLTVRLLASLSLSIGCARQAAPAAPAAPSAPDPPQAGVERYFPAADGSVYAYDTIASDTGETGVLMLQVRRPRPGRIDVTSGGRVERLAVQTDGIAYLEGGYLLKSPLELGATFPGRSGQVRITRVDEIVESPAGVFAGCITTLEETASATGSRSVTSVFCPDVGLVSLVVEAITDAGHVQERATLRSFGQRVDLTDPSYE